MLWNPGGPSVIPFSFLFLDWLEEDDHFESPDLGWWLFWWTAQAEVAADASFIAAVATIIEQHSSVSGDSVVDRADCGSLASKVGDVVHRRPVGGAVF